MPYDPRITDRRGELMGAGIMAGSQALADAITQASQTVQQLKGYRQVAIAMGLPAEQVDKMGIGTLKGTIMARETKIQQDELQRQARARASIVPFLQAFRQNLKPTVAPALPPIGDRTASVAGGTMPAGTVTPGANPLEAAMRAGEAAPEALQTDVGAKVFENAFAQGMKPRGGQVLDFGNGIKVWYDNANDKVTQLHPPMERLPAVPSDWQAPTQKVGDKTLFQPGPGRPWQQVSTPADAYAQMLKEIVNGPGTGGGGGAPGGPGSNAPKAMGGYEINETYNGMTYLGGDPNKRTSWKQTDTDQ